MILKQKIHQSVKLVFTTLTLSFVSLASNANENGRLSDECFSAKNNIERYLDAQTNSIGPFVNANPETITLMTGFIDWCISHKIIISDQLR